MRPRLWQSLSLVLALMLVGCAGPELAARDSTWPGWRPSPLAVVPVPPPPGCGGKTVPPGWPNLDSSRDLLAPFLYCTSPAEFVELQRHANIAKLVEHLEPWDAVQLGALGPLRAGSDVLNRKRAEYIVVATELYGPARAQVFTLFLIHSAFTSDLREMLRLLGKDNHLRQTLGQMHEAALALYRRGIWLSEYHDRVEGGGDVLRGFGRAARDALASSDLVGGARGMTYFSQQAQLPAPYRKLSEEIDSALVLGRPGDVGGMVTRGIDALTFGVPLGFYNLVAGTCHGLYELKQGHLEEAARELAAAVVMVALYAKGKAGEAIAEANVAPGLARDTGWIPELGIKGLSEFANRLLERLGQSGVVQLAKYIMADREAALFVIDGGEAGALRLYMANGDVEAARQLMAKAAPESPARPGGKMGRVAGAAQRGELAALVDEASGLTREVVDAKAAIEEASSRGARLPRNVAAVRKAQPSLDRPRPGVPPDSIRWREYVAYYEQRLAEMEAAEKAGTLDTVKPPLTWWDYEAMRDTFARGIRYQRARVAALRERLAKLQQKLHVQQNAGVLKIDLRFADALVIEDLEALQHGKPTRVESYSYKSRDLRRMDADQVRAQLMADAQEAARYYGGEIQLRTPKEGMLGQRVKVDQVHLVCDDEFKPSSINPEDLNGILRRVWQETGVEVRFE